MFSKSPCNLSSTYRKGTQQTTVCMPRKKHKLKYSCCGHSYDDQETRCDPEKLRLQYKQMAKMDLNFHGSPGQNLSAVSVAKKDWEYHHSLFVDGWKGRELCATHTANLRRKLEATISFFTSFLHLNGVKHNYALPDWPHLKPAIRLTLQ